MPPVPATRVSLRSIAELDNGSFGIVVDDCVRTIINDLQDRGQDGQERKLTIEIGFSRDMKRASSELLVDLDPQCKATLPKYRSGVTSSKLTTSKDGEFVLLFRANNAENVDQPAGIYDGQDENQNKAE